MFLFEHCFRMICMPLTVSSAPSSNTGLSFAYPKQTTQVCFTLPLLLFYAYAIKDFTTKGVANKYLGYTASQVSDRATGKYLSYLQSSKAGTFRLQENKHRDKGMLAHDRLEELEGAVNNQVARGIKLLLN